MIISFFHLPHFQKKFKKSFLIWLLFFNFEDYRVEKGHYIFLIQKIIDWQSEKENAFA